MALAIKRLTSGDSDLRVPEVRSLRARSLARLAQVLPLRSSAAASCLECHLVISLRWTRTCIERSLHHHGRPQPKRRGCPLLLADPIGTCHCLHGPLRLHPRSSDGARARFRAVLLAFWTEVRKGRSRTARLPVCETCLVVIFRRTLAVRRARTSGLEVRFA